MSILRPSIIGICFGIVAAIIFALIHLVKGVDFFKKHPPDLAKAVTIILSCGGAVSGFELARIAIFADPNALGIFAKHQEGMVIGGAVLFWVSVQSILKTFYSVTKN